MVLCVWPGIQWYRRGMHWLPLGEAYAAMHLFYYVLPCLEGRADWLEVSEWNRFLTLLGVIVSLAAFLTVYRISLPKQRPVSGAIGVMHREVNVSIVWGMFGAWLAWTVAAESGWLPNVGSVFNVFRSVVTASGSMAAVFLFYQLGRGRFTAVERVFLVVGFVMGLAFNFASGFLNGGAEMMGAALLAFSLGRKRLPAIATLVCLVTLAVLQLGKVEYRATYWAQDQNTSSRPIGLVNGYTTWLTAAWHGLMRENQGNGEQEGFLERISLIQILAHAMEVVPAQEPFLKGQTYLMLPELMVPRVFWPEKPRGTLPSETLGIHIGIQTLQGADITGVAVGQVAEAWINFGWLGFALAGAFMGLLFGLPARLSRELAPNQAGWLLASVFLIYSINLENTVVEILCSLSTALIMGVVLLLAISRERMGNVGQSAERRAQSGGAQRAVVGNQRSEEAPFSATRPIGKS